MKKRKLWIQRNARMLLLIATTVCLIFVLTHFHHTHTVQSETKKVVKASAPVLVVKQTPWFANPSLTWAEITVKRGNTLYRIFKNNHLNYATLKKVLTVPAAKKYLGSVRVGETFYLHNDVKSKQFVIKYLIDDDHTLYIYSDQGKFKSYLANKPLTKHVLYKSATIKNTFSKAGARHWINTFTNSPAHNDFRRQH